MVFCPKCGKKGIKGRFCDNCTQKELELDFKDISIKRCIDCGKFMFKNAWKEFDSPEEAISKIAIQKIRNPKNIPLRITPVYDNFKDKPGAVQDIMLDIDTESQKFMIPAKIDFTYCKGCSKAGTEYFEGTLQLRNASPELISFVHNDISGEEGVHINKETIRKQGKKSDVDMKITSAKYLRRLGKRIQQNFIGQLTSTSKLFTRDKYTSKEVHRVTVLFRESDLKVGDIIKYRGDDVKITKIARKISGTIIKTGKKLFLDI